MKYIDADKLIAEIESRTEDCKLPDGTFPTTTNIVRYEELSSLHNFITSLQQEQPSLPSGLDEAAEKYSENILANNEDLQDAIEDAFKAGAEWMAGRGISVEGDTENGLPEEYYIRLEDYLNSLPKGTKLVFQTRKKQ